MSNSDFCIAVDLDGLVSIHGSILGEPLQPMLNDVKQWLDDGKDVRIHARSTPSMPVSGKAVQEWCYRNIGREIPVVLVEESQQGKGGRR